MDDRSTRERVLDVAERRFAEQGFHGTSLADICGEVGIAKSSLLHHFASKRRIYAEVLERIAAELRDLHDQAMAAEGDAAARLRDLVARHLAWTRRRPDYNQLMLRELIDNQARPGAVRRWVLKPVLDDMAALVAEAQAGGGAVPADPMLFLFHLVGGIAYVAAGRSTIAGIMGMPDEAALMDRYADHVRRSVEEFLGRAPGER
jgi:AcrR family transcriptional regulator